MSERLRDPSVRERVKKEFNADIPGWENFIKLIGWENILINSVPSGKNKVFEGRTLAEIGRLEGKDPADAAFDLIVEEDGDIGIILFNIMSEDDIERLMGQEFSMFGSDGLYVLPGARPHPRLYGTFPRILGEYVRRRGVIPLEEAVRKMTSLPAQRLGLAQKGLIKEGMDADIVIFDKDEIEDRATYQDPCRYPNGVYYVIVNGEVVVENGKHTGKRPGKLLRRVKAR